MFCLKQVAVISVDHTTDGPNQMQSIPSLARIGNWTHMSGVAPSMEGHFQDAIMTELPRHVIISPLISVRLSTPENVSTVIRRNIDRLNWPQLESRLRLNHRRRNFRGRSHWSKTWGRKRGSATGWSSNDWIIKNVRSIPLENRWFLCPGLRDRGSRMVQRRRCQGFGASVP